MPERRPAEDKRARHGLGARSAQGETTPARPAGRMMNAPQGSHTGDAPEPPSQATGRARIARAGRARRRTVQDNPGTGRARI